MKQNRINREKNISQLRCGLLIIQDFYDICNNVEHKNTQNLTGIKLQIKVAYKQSLSIKWGKSRGRSIKWGKSRGRRGKK